MKQGTDETSNTRIEKIRSEISKLKNEYSQIYHYYFNANSDLRFSTNGLQGHVMKLVGNIAKKENKKIAPSNLLENNLKKNTTLFPGHIDDIIIRLTGLINSNLEKINQKLAENTVDLDGMEGIVELINLNQLQSYKSFVNSKDYASNDVLKNLFINLANSEHVNEETKAQLHKLALSRYFDPEIVQKIFKANLWILQNKLVELCTKLEIDFESDDRLAGSIENLRKHLAATPISSNPQYLPIPESEKLGLIYRTTYSSGETYKDSTKLSGKKLDYTDNTTIYKSLVLKIKISEDYLFIKKHPNLESITIHNCGNLKDFSLANAPGLKSITLIKSNDEQLKNLFDELKNAPLIENVIIHLSENQNMSIKPADGDCTQQEISFAGSTFMIPSKIKVTTIEKQIPEQSKTSPLALKPENQESEKKLDQPDIVAPKSNLKRQNSDNKDLSKDPSAKRLKEYQSQSK